MQILSAVFTKTPGAAAAAEMRRHGGTGGQARAKGYRAWATLVVVQARSQSAPGAVLQLPQDARPPGISSCAAHRLGQAARPHGGGRRTVLAHARRSHTGGESLPRPTARWGSREVM